MRKIKFLLVVCLLGMAATASAQFANAKGSSNSASSSALENWQSIKVSYLPASFKGDGGGDIGFKGAMVSYQKGFAVSQSIPLFVETGLGFSWIGGEIEDTGIDLNFFSLNVPVNFGYKHAFSDKVSVAPFVGITLRGNLFGNYKYEGESLNAFDKDEVGEELQVKRFNIGWQVGVGVNFNALYIGGSYGSDFNDIIEGGKAAVPQITLGFNF